MGCVVLSFLLLLALSPGRGPSLILAQDCIVEIVVKKNETRVIQKTRKETNSSSLNLYVKAKEGFEGLSVEGLEGSAYKAWFSEITECLPNNDKWYKLRLNLVDNGNSLLLRFQSRSCWKRCMRSAAQTTGNFSVSAYGPSEWKLKEPSSSCSDTSLEKDLPETILDCTDPPPPYPAIPDTAQQPDEAPDTLPTTTIIVAPAVAAAVLMTMVVVVGVCLRRKCVTTTTEPSEPATELHTIDNELYEPCTTITATTSPTPKDQPNAMEFHTVENELYEPCGQYIGNFTSSPGHQDALHVIENDIYEPCGASVHGYGH